FSMRNRIKDFRTRPSTTVSHIDLDVIEESDEETESDVELFKSLECLENRPKPRKAKKRVERNQKGKPLRATNWIPEVLSDSDHAEEVDESEQGMDKPNEDNRDEMQKEYDKMNKQFDSFDDFSLPVETECEAVPMKWDDKKKAMRPMTAIELAEREEKERLREERQRQRVIEEKENRFEKVKRRNDNEDEVEKVVARSTTPEMQQLRIPDLRTCLRRMSEMPRRPEGTPLLRRIRDSGALPRLTLATNNILDGLMRPHEMGTPGRRESVAVQQRRMTVAPSQAAALIEEEEEDMQEKSEISTRTVPSRRETDTHVKSSKRSTRTHPSDEGKRRMTRSGKKDGASLVEKEDIPVMLFSDSEEEQEEEELVGIEEAHSARVEAISARRSMMIADPVEPVLHSTPVRISSQEPRRASGRLSRLMGVSPIRRRASVVTTFDDVIDDDEEEEKTERRNKRESDGADSLVATRIEEKDEKMFVESGNEEDEDDLAEAIERSMILDESRRPTVPAAANDTVATIQATLMGDTVVGGGGTLMFENTMGGAYGDGTRATLAEEYAGDTLMMGDDDSVLPYAAPAARGSLQPQPRRRTTMGNETIDVSMTSVASVATQRNASMMSRRNVSQITNESRFANELPFYLHDFVGETALEQLLHVVGQDKVQEWRQQLPKDTLTNLKKLGEGTYGEVFSTMMNGAPVAMKIIPFEDEIQYFDGVVNGETLKSTAEILPEILITRELSSLDNDKAAFSTSTFIPLVQCHVVKGNYPDELLREWDEYDRKKGSENNRPSDYACPDALFVAIGLAMGGIDVESYKVKNEKESLSALFQLAFALVVAENELEFEHRDLHIGNVLIAKVPVNEEIKYRLLGRNVYVKSHGVKLSIIDFTNSRLRKEGTTIFLDLEQDEELFQGQGDYQFDIYRLMRQHNKGNWRDFCPKSNIYWLHYMAKELILEERKKGLAKGFTKRRRKELFTVFDSLPDHDEIKAFLNSEAVYDIMQEFVRFEEAE
ncbi:hasp-1, partial [Pristionchus pacificus]